MAGPIFIFLMGILVTINGLAFEIGHSDGRIIVSEPQCEMAKKIASSLAHWTKMSKADFNVCDPERMLPVSESSTRCSYDVTNCVPEHVAKYQGVFPAKDGPNCWNLALVLTGILPSLRYTAPEEIAFYMRPPLCRALANGEPRQPGDVGLIRQVGLPNDSEMHGFIYVSENIVYSKSGPRGSSFSLRSMDDTLAAFKVSDNPGCRRNSVPKVFCEMATAYFRCESLDEYLGNGQNQPKQILDALREFDRFEECFQQSIVQGAPLSDTAVKSLTDTSQALVKYLETNKSTDDLNKKFLLGNLQLRLRSIVIQLQLISGRGPGDPLDAKEGELAEFARQLGNWAQKNNTDGISK